MTWLALALAVAVLALVIVLPGLLIAFLLGFRGLWLPGLSVASGVSVLAMAATAAPLVGLTWGILPVALMTAVVAVICVGLRFLLWRGERGVRGPRTSRGAVLAVVGAVLLILVQLLLIIRVPDAISQTFDNIFHLNAIRFALDTGSASPLTLGQLTSSHSGGLPFYPSAWHAAGSLVVTLTGVSIPVASNAATIFFAAVWPLSAVLLVRALFGSRTALLVGAMAVSAALPSFPILPLDYGVLFPFMMSVTVLGTALALLHTAIETTGPRRRAALVALVGIVPGIVISHPGGFVALLAFGTVMLGWSFIRYLRSVGSTRARLWAAAGAAVYLLVVAAAWYVLRPPAAARTWVPDETAGQAIGEVLTVSGWHGPMNFVVAVFLIIGLVVAFRRRTPAHITALLLFGLAGILYVAVSGLPYPWLRDMLTGAWYNNSPRLAALLPIGWIPLAALGVDAAWTRLAGWSAARTPRTLVRTLLAVAAAVVLVVVPQVTVMRQAVASANFAFTRGADAPLISSDEWKLLSRLPSEVPKDAVIIGNPWTGTALAYALAGRTVVLPHTLTDITPEMTAILDGLNKAAPGSKACRAVADLKVTYVLDFGGREVNNANVVYTGLKNLSRSPNVTLVDSEGDARLYRVTGCNG
ncbi:MAG: hypothetical protein JST33_05535 [Actinobacteria bacterium]|nr:hypothetical protein [Actinomycetota bacterium]